MKSSASKMLPAIVLTLCMLIPWTGRCQTIPISRASCTDSVRALKHVWYREKSRADTLSKALADTSLRFVMYRIQTGIRLEKAEKAGFNAGKKEGKKEGRRQVLALEGLGIAVIVALKIFVIK